MNARGKQYLTLNYLAASRRGNIGYWYICTRCGGWQGIYTPLRCGRWQGIYTPPQVWGVAGYIHPQVHDDTIFYNCVFFAKNACSEAMV